MALAKRLPTSSEELAKKNDDHQDQAPSHDQTGSLLRAWRGPRRKRILLGVVAVYLLYVFFKNIPTDLPPVSQQIDPRYGPLGFERTLPPPRPLQEGPQHYFEGPIKFYNLASTLHDAVRSSDQGRNVLFAVSSLKSASAIIPIACEMAKHRRNTVHVVFMGRDEIAIQTLKDVNGVSDVDCIVHWHDGRPDFSSYSSDSRMEIGVRASLGNIHAFLRPQVVLIDGAAQEDHFFKKAMRDKTSELDLTLIVLPANAIEALEWITRLDSVSLSNWNKLEIDIIVHSSAESSGSLIRLLKSLQNADYFGTFLPRLTIELPPHIDPPTNNYLSRFRWPPLSSQADSKLVLRHRLNPKYLSSAEASLRTIESYYPAKVSTSHVLILTPDAELSQSYYHYLMYAILEYKYGSAKALGLDNLMGVSLDLPTTTLNGTESFRPSQASITQPVFLWQAPNSNAALYFGDKWLELHSFISKRLGTTLDEPQIVTSSKLVSERYPAWTEYMLELIRARGYSMLFPAFAERQASSIVTVHHELYQPPEEFADIRESNSALANSRVVLDPPTTIEILTADGEEKKFENREHSISTTTSILSLLSLESSSGPSNGAAVLPALDELSMLSYAGEPLTSSELLNQSSSYADEFSLTHGGCRSLGARDKARQWTLDYLFCESTSTSGNSQNGAG